MKQCRLKGELHYRILFVEPPKEYWFVMGEYLPPPYGILQLAAYLEQKNKDAEIQVLDCNAEGLDWDGLEKRMGSFNPDIVASSSLATCNTYVTVRTLVTDSYLSAISVCGLVTDRCGKSISSFQLRDSNLIPSTLLYSIIRDYKLFLEFVKFSTLRALSRLNSPTLVLTKLLR